MINRLDLLEWLSYTWWLIGIIVALFEGIREIITGTGIFGRWARTRIVGEIESDMRKFMDEHAGCKPRTEHELQKMHDDITDIKNSLKRIEQILAKDLTSFKVTFQIFDILLDHSIYGNHIEQIKQAKEDLHQHILNR